MKYFRNESVHEPDVWANDKLHGRIQVGNRGYDAVYIAVDENTGQVHNEIMMESEPATATYKDFNDTAKSKRYKKNDQLPLFHSVEEPGSFNVGLVTGTERGRTHAMVLLAIAKARGEEFVGPTQINPGDDLSPHSFALVKGAQKRGMISPNVNVPSAPTNAYDFHEPEDVNTYEYGLLKDFGDKPIPKEEVRSGKRELKKLLGRSTQPKTPPSVNQEQFDQLRLDGF